jgi:hypothetical protein
MPTAQRMLKHYNIQTTSLPANSPLLSKIAPDLPKGTTPAHILVLPKGSHFIWPRDFTLKKLEIFLNNSFKNN